jgi:uncharacterized protein (TIGR00297 family)
MNLEGVMQMNLLAGLLGSSIIAGIAYKKQSLSGSGAAAAIVTGSLLYACGSLAWFGTLIAFFVSSSVLSKWKQKKKEGIEESYEKTGRRDAGQVFANGGIALLLCLGNFLCPRPEWWNGFVGVMAAVNADTWATEIGGLSRKLPRSILSGKQVPPGTSGGVTNLGMAASLAGGMFIGLSAWILLHAIHGQIGTKVSEDALTAFHQLLLAGAIGGTIGSISDSIIGAAWQCMYRCSVCGKELERKEHCRQRTLYLRGSRFINNDVVNLISSIAGGTAAVILGFLTR